MFDGLLRSGPESKNALVSWLVECLERNQDRGKVCVCEGRRGRREGQTMLAITLWRGPIPISCTCVLCTSFMNLSPADDVAAEVCPAHDGHTDVCQRRVLPQPVLGDAETGRPVCRGRGPQGSSLLHRPSLLLGISSTET